MSPIRHVQREILSDGWGNLSRYEFELQTSTAGWQRQKREIWAQGDGVACILHDIEANTVLLVRQFRLVDRLRGSSGFLIEVPAGLLEGREPEEQMRRELAEETGYEPLSLDRVLTAYTTPGTCLERLHLYAGTYRRRLQTAGPGGGNPGEGEDIEVLHIDLAEAFALIRSGDIVDAKTIMLLQHLALRNRDLA